MFTLFLLVFRHLLIEPVMSCHLYSECVPVTLLFSHIILSNITDGCNLYYIVLVRRPTEEKKTLISLLSNVTLFDRDNRPFLDKLETVK